MERIRPILILYIFIKVKTKAILVTGRESP
jgi:hypothetical protein